MHSRIKHIIFFNLSLFSLKMSKKIPTTEY
nr:MAG TPA: hypothetical protein [Caudoviricetes sp.]